ncbi:MAG: tripartite tricarboxylate transporter substrate binding protein [Enterocloster asparagiformis]|nr:tripartite tricarboxylate transporter substrate binding protein [Enterocloster asparagiformis]
MRRKSLILLCAAATVALSACGGSNTETTTAAPAATEAAQEKTEAADTTAAESEAAGDWEWERDIEMVCTFDVGSGTDTTLRAILPLVEKKLGVNIVINNVSGASGVNGAEYFAQQPADGYTYSMYTPSHLIAAQNGTTSFDILNETEPVIRLVQDSNVIYGNMDLPFDDFPGMVEYAKAHPGELTLSLQSISGIDAVSCQDLFNTAGIDVTLVAADGSEAYAMVIGGHADLTLGSPCDGMEYCAAKQLKGIVLMADERSSVLPDIQTTVECGYDCTIGPWRGIVAMKGTPQAAIDSLEAAFADVCQNDPEWEAWKEANGLNDREGYATQEEFKKIWYEYYDTIGEVLKAGQ